VMQVPNSSECYIVLQIPPNFTGQIIWSIDWIFLSF